MKAAFFSGCTVPVRNLNYEVSARHVAEKLGIELVEVEAFGCCGFPIKSLSTEASLTVAARNLALASSLDLPVVTLCSACAGTLAEAAHVLDHDEEAREQVNGHLAEVDLRYEPGPPVFHFIRYLVTEVGLEAIGAQVVRPLAGFKFSPHYGCHYIKPAEATGEFDSPYHPQTLSQLIEVTGAEAVEDGRVISCCGGGLLGLDEELANKLSLERLESAAASEADGLILICPFCNVMLEGQQKKIAKSFEVKLKMPIIFYPQLLGLAMGFSPAELGFKLNRVKNKEFLKAFEEEG